jgi:Hemolysin coregulated protein Hcp (TssD)
MSFLAKLNLDGKEYNVLSFDYKASQQVDNNGKPSSKPHGFYIAIIVESDRDSSLSDWMVDSLMAKDGYIRFYNRDGMSKFKDVKFETTYCVGYKEIFEANGKLPMRQMLTLSSGRVIYGNTIFEETWARPRKAIEPPKPYKPEKITKEIKHVNGHFYNTNGTFEGKVDETKNTGSVNDVYSCTGKGKKTDENGDEIDVYNGITKLKLFSNDLIHSDLLIYAGIVHGEGTPENTTSVGISLEELKKERYSIANTIYNFMKNHNKEKLSDLPSNYSYAKKENTSPYKLIVDSTDEERNGQWIKIAIYAVINAVSDGTDYSNKAEFWDGGDVMTGNYSETTEKSYNPDYHARQNNLDGDYRIQGIYDPNNLSTQFYEKVKLNYTKNDKQRALHLKKLKAYIKPEHYNAVTTDPSDDKKILQSGDKDKDVSFNKKNTILEGIGTGAFSVVIKCLWEVKAQSACTIFYKQLNTKY